MEILKVKKILIIILSILISFSIVLFVYNMFNASQKAKKIKITEESINEIIENGNLVRDYSTFYSINSACQNYLEYALSNKLPQTYQVFAKNYTKNLSLINYTSKAKKYIESHFWAVDENYNLDNALHKAYFYKTDDFVRNIYVCQLNTGVEDEYLNMVVKLKTSGKLKYEILYLGI